MSDRFKIVTNGLVYRVEVHRKFLWLSWWSYIRSFGGPWETYVKSEAEKLVKELVAQDAADQRGWERVKELNR